MRPISRFGRSLLACATLLLVVLGFIGVLTRSGHDRLQALPALVIGLSLLFESALSRRIRRKTIMTLLQSERESGK